MLGQLFQTLARELSKIVPVIQQNLPQIINGARSIPPPLIIETAKVISKGVSEWPAEVSGWYYSLSPEGQERVQNAIVWAIKDLSSDFLTMAGLPVGPLVEPWIEKGVKKALVKLGDENRAPQREKDFIRYGIRYGLLAQYNQMVKTNQGIPFPRP